MNTVVRNNFGGKFKKSASEIGYYSYTNTLPFIAERKNWNLRESEQRKVIINDIKLFAQIHNRQINAYITKDRQSLNKMIKPLRKLQNLNFDFIDLTISLNDTLGRLF